MKIKRQLVWPCGDCVVRDASFCGTLIARTSSGSLDRQNQVTQFFMAAAKGEVIPDERNGGPSGPFILCKGWALRYHQFSDGRRQILSVLIPGDLFFLSAITKEKSNYSVVSATDIEFCELGRDGLKKEITQNFGTFEALAGIYALENVESNASIIFLSQPDPLNRIASFLRQMVKRLSERGIRIDADVYPFPLSPTDIADAVGLTKDHVNRAIQNLRNECVADLSNGELRVLDPVKFDHQFFLQARHASTESDANPEIRML